MVAAARAAWQSKGKIIVLEKTAITGGAALFASTLHTFRSQWQKERNIPDKMDEFFRKSMDATYWQLDAKLVERAYLATGEFFDWFCQISGEGTAELFQPAPYVFDGPEGQLGPDMIGGRCHYGTGQMVMRNTLNYCLEHGVEVLTELRAVDVLVKDGKSSAVVVDSSAGKLRIACKACIIASGSWVSSKEIMAKVEPRYLGVAQDIDQSCLAHVRDIYTGDGIYLAEKVGASIDYKSMCVRMMGPCVLGSSEVLNHMGNSPYVIGVNLNGERWSCEPPHRRMGLFRSGHALLNQPRGLSYCVFDENNLLAAIEEAKKPKPDDGGFFGNASFPDTIEAVHADIEKAVSKNTGEAFRADTIEALAEKIGMNPAALRETVERYNAGCAIGEDQMHKDPAELVPMVQAPFYAVRGQIGSDGAFGGLIVDIDMRVYDTNGNPIPGLYAVGDITSSRFIRLGDFKEQVLNDCSWAFASAYLAADAVCRNLEQEN